MVISGRVEPAVSTVPRGWLNSGKAANGALKRVAKGAAQADHTFQTVNS